MKALGIKVFDDDINQYKNDLMNLIKKYNNPLEISSFQHEPSENMQDLANEAKDVICHMNYTHFNMFYYVKKRNIDTLEIDINNAQKLNATKVVIHLDTIDPIPQNLPERNKVFIDLAVELLKKINKELGGNISICIENTYSNIKFYKTIIERVRDYVNIGFTYDFGHAKLWSNNSFQEWNDFLKYLHCKNIPLHFHVHHNDGLADRHYSIRKKLDYDGRDGYYSDPITVLNKMRKDFPEETFILETGTKQAVKDFNEFLKDS